MANVRDSDTSLWLHNKLGSNESWTSGSISAQLNPEVLRNIKECFVDLQPQVKFKLLLSFFHIPRRNMDEWRIELDEILEVAHTDSEQWVSMLAEIMKSYPATACLNLEINEPEENRRIFIDLVEEVTKELKRSKDLNLLPMECHYLNKNALQTIVGQNKATIKHFTPKRKPKSSVLRAELLSRATDLAKTNAKKIPAPTIPLRTRGMPRKMTDTTPLKGIPSQTPLKGTPVTAPVASRTLSRTPAGKKEGGVKLLEITEQPLGYAMAKRRKKMQEFEDAKKAGASVEEVPSPQVSETPDYAAAFAQEKGNSPPPTPSVLLPPPTPSPFPLGAPPTPLPISSSYTRSSSIPDGPPPTPNPQLPHQKAELPHKTSTNYLPVSTVTKKITQQNDLPHAPMQTMTKTVILQVPTNQPQQIVLSKDLMEKAQEIFKTANKATRPEKQHILKFMAGTRENPCPELGSIVTIKLSEHEDQVRQKDGSALNLLVETHFQMNYNTGEWKVIQKPPKSCS